MKKAAKFAYELKIIRLSILITFLLGVTGILVSWYSQSISVLIDSIYTIVAFFVYLFALYSTKKINLPADPVYQYGYFKFEPIAVMVQALLLFFVVILAICLAVIRFFHENIQVDYGIAAGYTALVIVTCFIMYIITDRCARKSGSAILAADTQIWWSDGWLSVGVLAGFGITYVANAVGFTEVPRYADPTITLFIVLLIVREPFRLLLESMRDLLDINPGKAHHKPIKTTIMQVLAQMPEIKLSQIRITKAGRKLFVDVRYILPKVLKTDELQALNTNIRQALQQQFQFIEVNFFI